MITVFYNEEVKVYTPYGRPTSRYEYYGEVARGVLEYNTQVFAMHKTFLTEDEALEFLDKLKENDKQTFIGVYKLGPELKEKSIRTLLPENE